MLKRLREERSIDEVDRLRLDARRGGIDDRHRISTPAEGSKRDLTTWGKTMIRERIAYLFRTRAGFRGHAQQIQQEINRLMSVLDGTVVRDQDFVVCACEELRFIR